MQELRAILTKDISYLYLLAFLLTGDQKTAMQCVVNGLEDSIAGNLAFKSWAHAWSKRTIIRNAVAMMKPEPRPATGQTDELSPKSTPPEGKTRADALIAAALQLPVFDRFVFAISVLEGYSDHDCARLLHCAPEEVSAARVRVFQNVTVPGVTSAAPAKPRSWPGAMLSQAVALFSAIVSLV